MKLSLNEAKLTGLWASHCVTYSEQVWIFRAFQATSPRSLLKMPHDYEALVVQW